FHVTGVQTCALPICLDYDAVNVIVDASAGRVTLPRVSGPEHCSAAGGWYYDVDPTKGAPSRLDMCKASCDHASAAGAKKLRVERSEERRVGKEGRDR